MPSLLDGLAELLVPLGTDTDKIYHCHEYNIHIGKSIHTCP